MEQELLENGFKPYGPFPENIECFNKDSELNGREYERIVKYVEEIRKDNGK